MNERELMDGLTTRREAIRLLRQLPRLDVEERELLNKKRHALWLRAQSADEEEL